MANKKKVRMIWLKAARAISKPEQLVKQVLIAVSYSIQKGASSFLNWFFKIFARFSNPTKGLILLAVLLLCMIVIRKA